MDPESYKRAVQYEKEKAEAKVTISKIDKNSRELEKDIGGYVEEHEGYLKDQQTKSDLQDKYGISKYKDDDSY